MAEQANYLTQQLMDLPIESRSKIELPSITTEVRLTYIGTFIFYSFAFLLIAFVFSHFAIRRINQSIEEFSQQINQIQTGQDLQNFNPTNLNFIFNELNHAFNNISELARQLGRVLNDKNLLEIKASLLSKLVIKNIRLDDWNKYISDIFTNMHKTLPFDFICVYLTEEGQRKLKIYWFEEANQASKLEAEQLLTKQFKPFSNTHSSIESLEITHLHLTNQSFNNFKPQPIKGFKSQPKFLVRHLEKEPQIGCVQGVFIHSVAMEDIALRLRIDSILVVLLNLLGSSRAISGYTQKLETAINLSEQENTMAAEVLYGHLLVKNTDQLAGINYQICSSSRFSGDIIQVKRSPSGSTFILVADATGHGLSATITVMPVISVFNAMVQKGYQLPFILSEMNKHLVRDLPDDRFVAAILVEIDPAHNEVSIWNGAMPAALKLNKQGEIIKEFHSKHMALGILDDAMFDSTPERLTLPKDGHLMVYSDGLIEQENSKQQQFGNQLLNQLLQQKITQDPIKSVIQSVLDFAELEQPDDDISLCQIDFAEIKNEIIPSNIGSFLCSSLHTPFEWQMKIYGTQIAKQSLPALCNEFMQAQGLSMPLKRWAFSVIHELLQKVINTNLLQLTLIKESPLGSTAEPMINLDYHQKKTQALNNLSNDYYLELKFKCILKDCDQTNNQDLTTAPCLIIEVSDNAKGSTSLMEEDSLAKLRTLADQVIVSQQGHHIQVRVG
ncbi:MAG: serine/threonine-protein phosphatase [Pseudomonadaceae bacterium]|nr:serine/threonine-protein phosphatase [Pseudomonadaceae bacterium]